ncbi:MAG: filamentous hemagglutinin N-terminal domain-containing protein, partial [Gammaproteobacteria bacterium]|nr:filamentous hemagglutinin N-terminal domain-containing protein [Gammaproteobacteria bacterium]
MSAKSIKNVTLIALAVFCSCALANPDGPQVVSGSATFSQPNANTLNVTNSHNAIINWQGFNIGAGQTTNFIQPSRNSAVLNRVLSNNPSSIYGNLNSNGKVFLINQHGLMIGAGARINTAGFYGSTLNITNEDFLKGKLNFNGGGFGGIQNHGYIHAGPGGNVVLIAPDIENGGVIEVDNGKVILAAGESIRITSLNDASIEFDVQSHDDNSIINLGDIIAKQGAARLFAGNLKHSGSINATGIVKNADG